MKTSSPAAPIFDFFRHRALIVELAKREISGRYRGASLGVFWSLASPFLMLLIYSFAFGTIQGGRWPEAKAADMHFSVVLFSGLIVYFLLSECMIRAPDLVVGNPSFVKRVVFPLEILPWPMLLSALFHTAMNVIVFVLLRLYLDGQFNATIFLLPLVLLPMMVVALGVSWLLASLAVYVRDISQVIGIATVGMLFLSSVMIPPTAVPTEYQWVLFMNPLTFIVDQSRAVMLWGVQPDWAGLGIYSIFAIGFAWLAYAWFKLTKHGFADVL